MTKLTLTVMITRTLVRMMISVTIKNNNNNIIKTITTSLKTATTSSKTTIATTTVKEMSLAK